MPRSGSKTTSRRPVVIDGCRTPFLRSGTQFQNLRSYDLARMAIKGLLHRSGIETGLIDRVIFGTVVQNMSTSNVARDAALAAGIPATTPAWTVTMACVSANQAITSAAELIRNNEADIVIAGGTESLSDIPIRYRKRFRHKLIAAQKYKSMRDYLSFFRGLRLSDLLPEIPEIAEFSTGRTMGEDCDRLAARIGVSREEQDEYAVRSHLNAARAIEQGVLAEETLTARIPPKFHTIDKDNGIRPDSTLEKLSALKPAFVKPHGTLTAGNSSFLTDGAAAVLLMAEETANKLGFTAKAAIRGYAWSAQDPQEELLLGPAYAIPKVLDSTGLKLQDIPVFELHEAFAAQVLANLKCLDSDTFARENLGRKKRVGEIPMDRLNIHGGSLSIGHPFGATGARLLTTTVNRMLRENADLGLTASCAAGAIGNAIVLERI